MPGVCFIWQLTQSDVDIAEKAATGSKINNILIRVKRTNFIVSTPPVPLVRGLLRVYKEIASPALSPPFRDMTRYAQYAENTSITSKNMLAL